MSDLAVKQNRARRLIVVAGLFVAASLVGDSHVHASCGDYLVHGKAMFGAETPGTVSSAAGQSIDLNAMSRPGDDRLNLPEPASPCASGRCHSVPAWPPINHPNRMVVLKESGLVQNAASSQVSDESTRWAFPADGSVPAEPCLSIVIPPPEHSFSPA